MAHVIFESAQGPNPSFFLFIRLLFDLGACWDQDLDQGLTITTCPAFGTFYNYMVSHVPSADSQFEFYVTVLSS